MSERYTVSAKSVDEAISLAEKLYGGKNKEITHRVVSQPKKGFLGLGSRDAVIEITVTEYDSGLTSLLDELKSYKPATPTETGYYTTDSDVTESVTEKMTAPAKEEPKNKNQKNPKAVKPAETKNEPKAEVKSEVKAELKSEAKVELKSEAKAESRAKNAKKPQKQKQNATHEKAKPASESKVSVPSEPEKKYAVSRDEMNISIEFINTMIKNMNLVAVAEAVSTPENSDVICTEDADVYPAINIVGEDTGILIGHHGETLDALQYLVNLALFRRMNGGKGGRENIKITVDIENYREKREETLRTLARRMAARAVKYKKNVFLEPMNPYERRIIHSELQDYPDVATHSVGSDANRKIIITYEGTDKATQQKRRSRHKASGEKKNIAAESDITSDTPVAMPLPTLDDAQF